jgi:hypothetical protein
VPARFSDHYLIITIYPTKIRPHLYSPLDPSLSYYYYLKYLLSLLSLILLSLYIYKYRGKKGGILGECRVGGRGAQAKRGILLKTYIIPHEKVKY